MPDTHFTITIFIVLLLIASGVAMITKWVPVPYTTGAGDRRFGDHGKQSFLGRFARLAFYSSTTQFAIVAAGSRRTGGDDIWRSSLQSPGSRAHGSALVEGYAH